MARFYRILITGAGGFIGSHVTELLLREGHQVRALARYNGRGDIGHLRHIPQDLRAGLEVRLGDITDPFLMRDLVAGLRYCPAPRRPDRHSVFVYSSVVISGNECGWDAQRAGGLPASQRLLEVVVTSTSEVYGTALYTPIDEEHPLQGQSPYSASKIAADKTCRSLLSQL